MRGSRSSSSRCRRACRRRRKWCRSRPRSRRPSTRRRCRSDSEGANAMWHWYQRKSSWYSSSGATHPKPVGPANPQPSPAPASNLYGLTQSSVPISSFPVTGYAQGGVIPSLKTPSPSPYAPYGRDDVVDVPDATDYFVGWRAWGVGSILDRVIQSPSFGRFPWPPSGPLEAHCKYAVHDDGRSPNQECTCGLYATYMMQNVVFSRYEGSVVGPVKAWGKIIRGTMGFRAQYMQPVAFLEPETYYTPFNPNSLFDLATTYDVPIIPSIAFKRLSYDQVLDLIRRDIRETGRLPSNGLRLVQQWLAELTGDNLSQREGGGHVS